MIVRVIADGVPCADDIAEPGHVGLFEDAADGETMGMSARLPHAPTRLDGPSLGFVVEVALFVIPVRDLPFREIAAHLQVERDRDQGARGSCRLLGQRGRCNCRPGGGSGQEFAAGCVSHRYCSPRLNHFHFTHDACVMNKSIDANDTAADVAKRGVS